MTKDYAIDVRVRNGLLLQAMRDAGYTNVAALARASGVSKNSIYNFLHLSSAPLTNDGELRAPAFELCRFLGKSLEQLFPAQHMETPLAKRRAELFCDIEELEQLCGEDWNAADLLTAAEDRVDAQNRVRRLLPKLRTDVQRKVIGMRYGIDGDTPATLDEVGKELRVTRERVRQIEHKALRIMGFREEPE